MLSQTMNIHCRVFFMLLEDTSDVLEKEAFLCVYSSTLACSTTQTPVRWVLRAPSLRVKVSRVWNATPICFCDVVLRHRDPFPLWYRLEEEVARKKLQQDEEERRLEQQRRQTEALRRLQEQQQQQRAKTAPWSQQTPGAGSSLADIQRQEREKKEVLTS